MNSLGGKRISLTNSNYSALRKSEAESMEGIDALELVGLPDGAENAKGFRAAYGTQTAGHFELDLGRSH